MQPESAELDTNEPTNSGMTHKPANVAFQGSSNPLQYQSFDPDAPPVYVQQGIPVNFEIAHPSEANLQELNSRLDTDCYCFYRYLSLGMLVFDVLGTFSHLMLLVSRLSDGDELLIVYRIFTNIWNITQLYKIFQAMNLKNLQYAKQAIKMMKIYMIIIFFTVVVQFSRDSVPLFIHPEEKVIMFVFFLTVAESLYYLVVYFGARKVTEVLTQIYELRILSRPYSPLSSSSSSPARV